MRFLSSCILLCCLSAVAVADEPTLDQLVEQLNSGSAEEKIAAADAIAQFGSQGGTATASLTAALKSDVADLPWHAARTLGAIGPAAAAAVPALAEALGSENVKLRAYSAYALGEMGEAARPATDALAKVAFDEDLLVRRSVMKALRSIKPPPDKVIPILMKSMEDAEPTVVMQALNALSDQGEAVVPFLAKATENDKSQYWACVVLCGMGEQAKEAVPSLVKVLDSEKPQVRLQAVLALGQIGSYSKEAVPTLIKLLEKDPFPGVRYTSAFSLGRIGDKQAISTLQETEKSDDPMLKMVSAWALAILQPGDDAALKHVVDLIMEGLRSSDENLRSFSARALTELKGPPEVVAPALLAVLNDDNPEVVGNALDALAALGEKVVPGIQRALKKPEARRFALEVVRRMGPEAKGAVPALVAELEDEDAEFRRHVMFALAAIGPEAAPAVPALAGLLSAEDAETRHAAIFTLGKIGPAAQSAVTALKKSLTSDDEFDQVAAVWALVKIGPVTPRLVAVASPLLVKALDHERENVRIEAVIALGEMGAAAKPVLNRVKDSAQNDPSEQVRAAAAYAAKRIEE